MARNLRIPAFLFFLLLTGLVVAFALWARARWAPPSAGDIATPTVTEAEARADSPTPAPTIDEATPYPPPATPTPEAYPPVERLATPDAYPQPGAETLFLPSVHGHEPTPTSTPEPTRPPPPTPTPTIPWPEPLPEPGRSKLGLHIQWNNSPEIMEFIRRTKPAVVKAISDLGFMAEVKAVSPHTVTIGRLDDEDVEMVGDPRDAARAFVDKNLGIYLQHPAVDYWEGPNEPGVSGRMEWYAQFEAERVRLMAEHGLRTAVGSFSTGVPEFEEFIQFLPAIRAAQQYGGILTLHEYDAPTMDRTVGKGLPGRPGHPHRGVLMLRYRWYYEEILKPRGLVVPLVISEAGVDGGVADRPGPDGLGWLDFVSYWAERGLGDDPVAVYMRQLDWYDEEVQQDDYVLGFAVFTAGPKGERWRSFDITPILRHIAHDIMVPKAQ